jgi:hypothetical protein
MRNREPNPLEIIAGGTLTIGLLALVGYIIWEVISSLFR